MGASIFNPAGAGTGLRSLSVSSIGDGAPGSLEAVPTAGLPTPTICTVYLPDDIGEVQEWVLLAGSVGTLAGQVQQPNDFNASSNAKYWMRKG